MAVSLGSPSGGALYNVKSPSALGYNPNPSGSAGYASSTVAPKSGGFNTGLAAAQAQYGGQNQSYGSNITDTFRNAFGPIPGFLEGLGGPGGGGSSSGGGGGLSPEQQWQESERNALAMSAMKTQNKSASYLYKKGIAQDKFDKEAVRRLPGQFEGILGKYNEAYGEARASNESRYNQLLGITDATTGQRLNDITSAYDQQQADAQQRLIGLGMGNTTIAPTLGMGFEREKQASLNRAADEMQQTKLGIIERRDDMFPDLASLQGVLGATSSAFGTRGIEAMLQAFGNIRST